MSRAYSFQKNTKPQPVKKSIIEKYNMKFTYYDDVKAFLEGKDSHSLNIECGNIPDACGMFHEAVKKIYTNYYISDISVSPIIKEVKSDEETSEVNPES